jgi:predicted ester cyclase
VSIKENKDLMINYFKESNESKGDAAKLTAIIDKYVDAGFVYHTTNGDMNLDQTKQLTINLWKSFPDYRNDIEEILAEEDKVAIRHTWGGTHKGQFMGIAPTGKKAKIAAISITRMIKGKMIETWVINDSLGLMQQIGAFPAAPPRK